MISIDEFRRSKLIVGRVLEAEAVPGSKKLLKLVVSLGTDDQRTLVAGIGSHYSPQDLIDKLIVVVANLEPATIRGVQSQGMLLAAEDPATGAISLLTLDRPVKEGSPVL